MEMPANIQRRFAPLPEHEGRVFSPMEDDEPAEVPPWVTDPTFGIDPSQLKTPDELDEMRRMERKVTGPDGRVKIVDFWGRETETKLLSGRTVWMGAIDPPSPAILKAIDEKEKEWAQRPEGYLWKAADGWPEDVSHRSDCQRVGQWLKRPTVKRPPPALSTGFVAFDASTRGGFRLGTFVVFEGLTSRGKSLVTLNIARAMAKLGTHVLYVTLEDVIDVAARRLLCAEANAFYSQVEEYDRQDPATKAQIDDAEKRLDAMPLWLESSAAELPELEAVIRKAVSENGVSVVFVDQTSWIQINERGVEDDRQRATRVADVLAKLAVELNIVVEANVQLNRDAARAHAEGKRVEMHQGRDSGRIEQNARLLVLIQSTAKQVQDGVMILEVAKQTVGKAKIDMRLKCDAAKALLEDDPTALEPRDACGFEEEEAKGMATEGPTLQEKARKFVTDYHVQGMEGKEVIANAKAHGMKEGEAEALLTFAKGFGKYLTEVKKKGDKRKRLLYLTPLLWNTLPEAELKVITHDLEEAQKDE